MLIRTIALLLLAFSFNVNAQIRLLPVDQAASVPDFFSFRAQLQGAIARHDVASILAALNKDVKLSFGGSSGAEEFKEMWKPSAPDSTLWEVLATTLALGGTFGPDGSFTAPYVFTRWPQDKDAFSYMAAIGTGIRVRSAPDVNSGVVGSLDFSVVERAEATPIDSKWVKVKLHSDRIGFVDARFLRSPIDYRITFSKLEGRWQIVFFVAGD